MRILVIDDNHDVADTMGTLLEMLGHEVRTAYCGKGGLEIASEWHPAVVLCDIGLPDMNGFLVAQALRDNESLRDTTLVAISAYDSEATQERAYQSGFDLYMTKPADVVALLDAVAAKERSRSAHDHAHFVEGAATLTDRPL